MAEDHAPIESILAIDCGSTLTRALLVDRVEGDYRLVARSYVPSSLASPQNDMVASVRQALDRLTEVTGWRFLDDQDQIISPQHAGDGVDAVVAVTSATEPLRLLLMGISHQASLETARRALPMAYAVVEGLVSADRGDGIILFDDYQGQLGLIQGLAPDAIVLVGGIDGGAGESVLQSARVLAWGYSMLPPFGDTHPPVIFAGNAELRQRIRKILEPAATVYIVENVRPGMEVENPGPLQVAVEDLHRQRKMGQLPGFETLATWSSVPVLPTGRAFAHTIQYLARLDGIDVLGVDVGGATTSVAAVVDRQPALTVHPDLGLSYHAARILDCVPVESLLRWLPFEMDASSVYNSLHNKSVYPHTLPQTRRDLLLEQALAREILRLALADAAPGWLDAECRSEAALPSRFDLIVGSGGILAHAPHHGQAALVLLDALQPVGVSSLALDSIGLVAALGAVARLNPVAAAQVMERDALLKLGTVIAPVGTPREGEVALNCKIEYNDGRSLEVEAACGSLRVIPLPAGQTASLELWPGCFDLGLGTRERVVTIQVEGGSIGIIVDARGRPLPMANDLQTQRERVRRWLSAVGT